MRYIFFATTLILFGFYYLIVYPERCVVLISQSVSAHSDILAIDRALDVFRSKNGMYPNSIDSLSPDYLKKIPVDPWGRSYIYLREGNFYKVISYGADGLVGGKGSSMDINGSESVSSIINEIRKPILGCRA